MSIPWGSQFFYFMLFDRHCRFEHSVGKGCGISTTAVTAVRAAALPKGAGRLAERWACRITFSILFVVPNSVL